MTTPGAALALRDGTVIGERVAGAADPSGRPWTVGVPSQIASISKHVAATLAVLLAVRDGLDLRAPLAELVPGGWGDVGLHELLTHTAGVPHWIDGGDLDPSRSMSAPDRLRAVLRAPRGPIGTFRYSSPGYLVVAAALAEFAGTPYPHLVRRELLDPLGLDGVVIGDPAPADAARGFRGGVATDIWDLGAAAGTGDLWASTHDLARLVAGIHAGGVLPQVALELLEGARVAIPARNDPGPVRVDAYGYGGFVGTVAGRAAVVLPGDNPGYLSLACWIPSERIAAAALVNDELGDVDGFLVSVLSESAESPR